ncbi:MAG: hypothetical protein M3352_11700 [Bacteroidota bacterium]|nr:hypothetical protein [Bacteroidota bacterium]
MKKILFVILIIRSSLPSFSQSIETKVNEDFYLKEQDGTFVQRKTSFTEVGSTTLPEKNCLVLVKTRDGKVYNRVKGRIDLLTNGFIYTVKGQDLICAIPISQIIFDSYDATWSGAIFKNGYPFINKQNDKSFYQVLSEGKATLLKYYAIQWFDDKPYNTTNITRIYTKVELYYLYLNGEIFKLEKNNGNLLKLLAATANYISTQKLNLKKEEDVIKLVAYYNSL